MSKSKGFLKKSVAYIFALLMVSSIGLSSYAIDNTTTESTIQKTDSTNDDANALEDGTYYVAFSTYRNPSHSMAPLNNWEMYIYKYAMITAKDGQYTITFKFDSCTTFGLIGFLKPEYFSQLTDDNVSDEGYATKNMLEGFDVESSGLYSGITNKISDEFNEHYYDIDYTQGEDGSWYLRYTTDDLSQDIYLSGLGKTNLAYSSYVYMQLVIDLDEEKLQPAVNLGSDIVEGEFSYNKSDLVNAYKGCLTSNTVTLETRDGKIYATYVYDDTAYLEESERYVATQPLDEYQNPIEVKDGTITLEYSSYEDLIFGKRIYIQLTRTTGKLVISNSADLIPNITSEDVVLTDETTGVKVKTNSLVVSKDSTLNVQEVTDDPTISGNDDPYEFINTTLGNAYNNINRYSISIQQGDDTITTTSQPVEIYLPIKEGMNKDNLRLLFCSSSDYGWLDSYANIVTEDGIDYYVIKTSSTWDFNSVYALYDLKSTTTDGTSLESGTYTVPIALFNATNTEEMSMSNKCLGDTATLIVDEQGNKTILLDFKSVELLNTQGYLIQMWYEDSDGEYKEVTYTGYYKNEDGTYFTDDINAGTTDYYPTSAYFVLPTDSSQFNVKFRVSAMDALLNGSGDSSREAIFTIYYGNATKVSDEILTTPEEEVVNREQTDTTALTELISSVENITNSDGKYTVSTYTIFSNALANAKSVLNNSTSSQDSIDSAYNTLKDAYDTLEIKPTTNTTLADGKYSIYAQMLKTDRESFSMSNNAITHTATLEVIDGEYYLTLEFNGLSIYNQFGYLSSLAYYNAGYTYNEYGLPKGELTSAEVLSTYDVVDQYNTEDTPYPHELKIKLVDKSSAEYVPLQVFVPIMEAISEGSGTQDVLMQLDWDTLKVYEDEEQTTTTSTTTDTTTITDILRLKKYILGISTDGSNLDYNQDGSINIFDLLSVKNSLFKK